MRFATAADFEAWLAEHHATEDELWIEYPRKGTGVPSVTHSDAIDVFEGAQALKVPKSRFAPVKTTDDLLLVRSDAYALTGEGHLELVPRVPPLVELDPEFFKLIDDFDARFSGGPPSLVGARHLRVEGDVSFGAGVVVKGEAVVKGPRRVGDGEVLDGSS